MIKLPKKLLGTDAFTQWANQLRDCVEAIWPQSSESIKVTLANRGAIFRAILKSGGGGANSISINLDNFTFSRAWADYWTAISNTTGETVRIAKMWKLRNSITKETFYSTNWTYSYPHNANPSDFLYGVYRVATATVNGVTISERQGITPVYSGAGPGVNGDVIWAVNLGSEIMKSQQEDDGKATSITWLELSDGRAWTRFVNQNFG